VTETPTYGAIPIEEALKYSGFDFLCAIRDGKLPHPKKSEHVGFSAYSC
jgi:hypothetical protein